MPSFSSRLTTFRLLATPGLPASSGRNFGTMKRLIPFVPFGAPGSRASTRWHTFEVTSLSPQVM